MKQLTKSKSIRLTEQQFNTLSILENYGVNVNQFIRLAISEKISFNTMFLSSSGANRDANITLIRTSAIRL